jgi:NAD(P) transhydrogenase subunit alpha
VGEGGYAKKLPDAWLEKERDVLKEIVAKSDIIILSALIPGRLAPILITDDMIRSMPAGGAIVDISIDQGGELRINPAAANHYKIWDQYRWHQEHPSNGSQNLHPDVCSQYLQLLRQSR